MLTPLACASIRTAIFRMKSFQNMCRCSTSIGTLSTICSINFDSFSSVRISKRHKIIFRPRCVMYDRERARERNSLSLADHQRGGAVFSAAVHFRIGVRVATAHRPASPCVIDRALRLSSVRRARPAAPAGPTERFFLVVALLHGGVGVFAPIATRTT